MHLLESYSLSTGAKIGKPFIYSKFFPLGVSKYITLQPFSKSSKSYSYWNEVVDILKPHLSPLGIEIVQIGAKDERPIPGCYYTAGQTSVNQVSYIVKNSLLHLGVDSFATHIASGLGKKIVTLYSNNYIDCVKPFWTNPVDRVLLEPDREQGEKPLFSFNEDPKSIDRIKPDKIAEAVCSLLGISFNYPYRSLYLGKHYATPNLESVPNQLVDPKSLGAEHLIVRMDFEFNEEVLARQLDICSCSIITDKPINPKLLETKKHNLKEVAYILTPEHNPLFVEEISSKAIPYALITDMDNIEHLKLFYMDFGIIHKRNRVKLENYPELKDKTALKYKSSKFTASNGKLYPSKTAWIKDAPITDLRAVNDFQYSDEISLEMEHFHILETK